MHNIRIQLAEREGALVRLLSNIERRGFIIESLDKTAAQDGVTDIAARITPRGERSLDVLTRQLSRLFDVMDVHTPVPAHMASHAMPPGEPSCRHPQ